MKNRRSFQTGFSLVELLVVVALIAIVAAFAVPVWQDYRSNSDLKSAARTVMADLAETKQRAVEKNVDVYRMTFSVGGNSYALSRTDMGTLWIKTMTGFGPGISLDGTSPPNFSGGSVVSFNRRGTLSPGNLRLRNGHGSTATITVNITGRTYVEFNMQ